LTKIPPYVGGPVSGTRCIKIFQPEARTNAWIGIEDQVDK